VNSDSRTHLHPCWGGVLEGKMEWGVREGGERKKTGPRRDDQEKGDFEKGEGGGGKT